MSAHKIEIASELVAEGKRLYEETLTPIADIAAMMGVCRETLNNRSHEWGWKRRAYGKGTIDLVRIVRGATSAAVTAAPSAQDAGPVSEQRRAALAERIQTVVEQVMGAVERISKAIKPGGHDEAERSARACGHYPHAARRRRAQQT
jgi:hypothetical protein